MATLNLYAAKTQLSKLVDRAAAGEEIVIAKAGKPMAKLVPLERPTKLREPGFLKGMIWIAERLRPMAGGYPRLVRSRHRAAGGSGTRRY